MEKRIFKPKKSNLIAAILLAGIMLGVFGYVLIYTTYQNPNIFTGYSKIIFLILNSSLILFFLFVLGTTIQQTVTGKEALIISPNGIYNGTDLCKLSVSWEEVEKICINTYIIVIHLKNTDRYIQTQKGRLKKSILKNRLSKFGSPIIIDCLNLDADIFDLENTLNEGYVNAR